MSTEEVTYADVTIIKKGTEKQKHKGTAKTNPDDSSSYPYPDKESSTSSEINCPQKSKPDPDESLLTSHPCQDSPTTLSLRCTVLLLCLCLLLLATTVTMAVLYVLKEVTNSDITQRLDNATAVTRILEANITDLTQRLESLQVSYDNATVVIRTLEANLTDVQEEAWEKFSAGWKYFKGSYYYFSTDKKNWADSRDACVTMGGHLVIIETPEEQV
ncbi:uncharacterized protein LOC134437317 [Engraulis encrasicolus]|uniref:uncharacterized protein LOC134437317 n=1 Tax=Engraulis encrasicolus TaxID=184585 RepID=UPI002FD74F83